MAYPGSTRRAVGRRSSEGVLLAVLGLVLFLAGCALVAAGVFQLSAMLPPTIGRVTNVLFALGIGFPILTTGCLYLLVARSGAEPEFGPDAISVRRDPLTGAREWTRIDSVAQATLRPWSMGPWIHHAPYAELNLKIKVGTRTSERRFYVRLGDQDGFLRRRLAESFGERLTEPHAAA